MDIDDEIDDGRLEKLNLLGVDPRIIDLAVDEPAKSSSSVNTPEFTPKERQCDPEVVEVDRPQVAHLIESATRAILG